MKVEFTCHNVGILFIICETFEIWCEKNKNQSKRSGNDDTEDDETGAEFTSNFGAVVRFFGISQIFLEPLTKESRPKQVSNILVFFGSSEECLDGDLLGARSSETRDVCFRRFSSFHLEAVARVDS